MSNSFYEKVRDELVEELEEKGALLEEEISINFLVLRCQ